MLRLKLFLSLIKFGFETAFDVLSTEGTSDLLTANQRKMLLAAAKKQHEEEASTAGAEILLEPGCWQAAQAWDKGNHLHLITTKAVFLSTRKWGKSETNYY